MSDITPKHIKDQNKLTNTYTLVRLFPPNPAGMLPSSRLLLALLQETTTYDQDGQPAIISQGISTSFVHTDPKRIKDWQSQTRNSSQNLALDKNTRTD